MSQGDVSFPYCTIYVRVPGEKTWYSSRCLYRCD